MLIVFEGIDGSGKTTQSQLLRRWLSRSAECALTTWNSSKLIAPATKKAKKKRVMTPVMYSLFHAADFADRHERIVLPALAAGHHVIADRYVDTAIVRDGCRGRHPDDVRNLYSFAKKPDITFYLRISAEEALARKDRKPNYYEAGRDVYPSCDAFEAFCLYQGRVIKMYDALYEQAPRAIIVDATLPVRKMQKAIRRAVLERIVGIGQRDNRTVCAK